MRVAIVAQNPNIIDTIEKVIKKFQKIELFITDNIEKIDKIIDLLFFEIDSWKKLEETKQIRSKTEHKKKCYIIAILKENNYEYEKEIFSSEIEEIIIYPIDEEILKEKLDRIYYRLTHSISYHPNKYSLFYGRYDSFHVHFSIKCENDLLQFMRFLEGFKVNPIHIIKFVNCLKGFEKKINLVIEKSVNYLCITTNHDFSDRLSGIKNLFFINQRKVFTYKLEIIFKERMDKLIHKSGLKEEIYNLRDSYKIFKDDSKDNSVENIIKKINLKNHSIKDLYELSIELKTALDLAEEIDDDLKDHIISFLVIYLRVFNNFSDTKIFIDEIYYIIEKLNESNFTKEKSEKVINALKELKESLTNWLKNVKKHKSINEQKLQNRKILNAILDIKELLD